MYVGGSRLFQPPPIAPLENGDELSEIRSEGAEGSTQASASSNANAISTAFTPTLSIVVHQLGHNHETRGTRGGLALAHAELPVAAVEIQVPNPGNAPAINVNIDYRAICKYVCAVAAVGAIAGYFIGNNIG